MTSPHTQPPKRRIRVFIASPGDLAAERRAFREEVEFLNTGFGDGADVEFIPLGWEDTLAATGRRSQSVINRDIDACDVFILALHRRWGQDAPDAKPYTSYTEEEFHRALDRFKRTQAPEIFVFLKHIDPGQMADPGPQLQRVLTFRKELEKSRAVLYRNFTDEKEFQQEVRQHLCAYAKGRFPAADETLTAIILPVEYIERVEKAEAEADERQRQAEAEHSRADAAAARAAKATLALAHRAAKAALDGRVEDARQDFAVCIEGTTDRDVLALAVQYYFRVGELPIAEALICRYLDIVSRESDSAAVAAAFSCLGVIYSMRTQDMDAERMFRRAIEIGERSGRPQDTATFYGNLALVYQHRGDLDEAEKLHNRALVITEAVGRLHDTARHCHNLALIRISRGELDEAETLLRKALAIHERLGHKEGMAYQFCSLGGIYKSRGDLAEAESMLLKAIAIDEALGKLETLVGAYGNLALIHKARGDLDAADAILRNALAVDEKLLRFDRIAVHYGNLGTICITRGNVDEAERMFRKSLAINEHCRRPEGAAHQYENLADVAERRGDMAATRRLLATSRDVFASIGIKRRAAELQSRLDALPPE